MPSKKSDLKQARIALKKLRTLGLYTGDLRKAPSKSALKKIKEFAPVLKGEAVVLQPPNAKKFKGVFKTVGKNIIVPRRKGERISIDKKTGELVSKRKVGKRTVTARGLHVKRGEKIPQTGKRVQYAIPFNSTGGGVNWIRFPNWTELQKFMAGYDYKGWQNYVVREDVENEFDDDELNERLENKRKGRPIKGAPLDKIRKIKKRKSK